MNTKKSIQVINSLTEINNARIDGYELARAETKDNALLSLFHHFILDSKRCAAELAAEIGQLGGTAAHSPALSAAFFRDWTGLKAALHNNDRKAVLNACTEGEDKALDVYNNVLTNDIDFLTIEQHKMLYKQYVTLKSAHDQIKSVKDTELSYGH